MTPIISLVTGTYNRLLPLKRMLASFLSNIPRGMDIEIIIVDGKSDDGTLEWCRNQARDNAFFHLIEQGELLGAIRAFDAGAEVAAGDYVLLANDDIIFAEMSVLPALFHLETHPECGAVAFADDRPAPGYGDGFKVQTMSVQSAHKRGDYGAVERLPYAQVGLFRRWLGNRAGWWGSHDTLFNGHTYGGDNYLSARIYELGYTIDPVDGAKVFDTVTPDGLRVHNAAVEQQNSGAFYRRFPQPPIKSYAPQIENPQSERLRILYLPVYERGIAQQQNTKRGLREALARVGLVCELDYVNTSLDLPEIVAAFQPHLLLTQFQTANALPMSQFQQARTQAPNMLAVNWNGDVYEDKLTHPDMLDYLRCFDLQLVVNESVIPIYEAQGIRAAYWQVSFEPVCEDILPDVPYHDVVFLANAYSAERRELGHMLQTMAGVNVGLYGRGWRYSNGDTLYDFATGMALYRHARIAIGDNQFLTQRGFVSNRIFEALRAGVLLLHQTIPGLEELTGLQDGVHYVAWSDLNDLQQKIRYWLDGRRESRRWDIARAGRDYVLEKHNFDVRVEELFQLIENLHELA